MTLEQQKKYIVEQRAKGVPDDEILSTIRSSEATPKIERGFAGEILPTLGAIAGGIGGGLLGAGAGGVGAIPGAIAGAAGGGALGELAQQGIEKYAGQRRDISAGQVVASGAISGGLEAVTGGVGLVAKPLIKPALAATRNSMVTFLGRISGYAPDVVERALTRTPGAVETVSLGETGLNNIIARTAKGVSLLAGKTFREARDTVGSLSKISYGGKGDTVMRDAILNSSRGFINNTAKQLRELDNIGVTKEGVLLFNRPTMQSRIVNGSDQRAIQEAFNSMKSIYKDSSIKNIDSVFEKLLVLKSKTPIGSPTGPETRSIIGRMINEVSEFVKSVPDVINVGASDIGTTALQFAKEKQRIVGTAYNNYAKFIEGNLPKRIMIRDAQEIFGGSSRLSPKETSLISKRLLQIFNTGNLAVRESVDAVSSELGEDIVGGAAGALIKTGDQMSVRASQLTRRGLLEKVVEFLPRKAVQNYVRTGTISGDFAPTIKILSAVTGKTEKAILQEIVNLFSSKTSN